MGESEFDVSGLPIGGPAHRLGGQGSALDHLPRRLHQRLSRRGQRHIAGRASEQIDSEVGLEGAARTAERRLQHSEPFGCTTEVQLFGDCEERFDLLNLHRLLLFRIRAGASAVAPTDIPANTCSDNNPCTLLLILLYGGTDHAPAAQARAQNAEVDSTVSTQQRRRPDERKTFDDEAVDHF